MPSKLMNQGQRREQVLGSNSEDDMLSGVERNLAISLEDTRSRKRKSLRDASQNQRIQVSGNRRDLQQVAWSLLVVNVGGPDYALPSTEEQLVDDWFQDSACLRTQIAECSRNQMTFSPRVGPGINNGTITILFQEEVSASILNHEHNP